MKLKGLAGLLGLKSRNSASDDIGFQIVTRLARFLLPQYRFTWPGLAWFGSAKLNRALEEFDEKHGFNTHRRLALQQLQRLTLGVRGDTAECGVFQGCGSYIILEANQRSSIAREHHMFDSFCGLSSPSVKDGRHWAPNDMMIDDAVVQENLRHFAGVKLYKGWIPDRFDEIRDRTFSFVHIDVDLYEPTLASIEFFYPRLNPGGILVCDDYGFSSCPGATEAVEAFLEDKFEKMVSLSGGGGFLIKGCATAKE